MTVEAHAKVNLTLEVYGKRPDGYHALRSLVAPISLADTLDVELTDDGNITTDTGFPDDLCVKAARVLANAGGRRFENSALRPSSFVLRPSPFALRPSSFVLRPSSFALRPSPFALRPSTFNLQLSLGARIRVTKRIPVGGGLGGGSADAAATLRALNELWQLGRTPEELAEIGAAVGSDVPALVLAQHYHRIVLMEGRGERVALYSPSPSPSSLHLILANPGIAVSTAEVYRLCKPRTQPADGRVNDLQTPAVAAHPEIARTLETLRAAGAADVMMSGSGATCFGFAADEESARRISAAVKEVGLNAWACRLFV